MNHIIEGFSKKEKEHNEKEAKEKEDINLLLDKFIKCTDNMSLDRENNTSSTTTSSSIKRKSRFMNKPIYQPPYPYIPSVRYKPKMGNVILGPQIPHRHRSHHFHGKRPGLAKKQYKSSNNNNNVEQELSDTEKELKRISKESNSLSTQGVDVIFNLTSLISKQSTIINKLRDEKKIYLKDKETIGKDIDELIECVICLENKREIILLPCKHFCICNKCNTKEEIKVCPICQKDVGESMEVFFC